MESAVFERTVTVGAEGAVLEDQIVGIAERLLAGNMAIDESQVSRMPSELFAVEFRIINGHILDLP